MTPALSTSSLCLGKIYSVLTSELDSDCSNAVNNNLFALVIGKNKWASTIVEINQCMVVS